MELLDSLITNVLLGLGYLMFAAIGWGIIEALMWAASII